MKVIPYVRHENLEFDYNVGDKFVTLSNNRQSRRNDDELTFTVNRINGFSKDEQIENLLLNYFDEDHDTATIILGSLAAGSCALVSSMMISAFVGNALGVVLAFASLPLVYVVGMFIMATVISKGRNLKSFKADCNNQTVMKVVLDKDSTQEEKDLIHEINDLIYHQGVTPWNHIVKPLCIFADEDYQTLPKLDRATINLDTLQFMKQELEEQKRTQAIDVIQEVNKEMLALRALN